MGTGELLSRHTTEPWKSLFSLPGIVYVLINGLAAVFALHLIFVFDIKFGMAASNGEVAKSGAEALKWTRLMVAGFGSMGLFRSSIMVVRYGDNDIPIGPNELLRTILKSVDQSVFRSQAVLESKTVSQIMKDVSFVDSQYTLPLVCFTLLKTITPEQQKEVLKQVELLKESDQREKDKSLLLGLMMYNLVGENVLESAVKSITRDGNQEEEQPDPAAGAAG